MKNILIVAYYYPPLGGAGVQRTLKFAKYLSKMGYKVCVLTVLNEEGIITDNSMCLESTDHIKVYRAAQSSSNFLNKYINKKINAKAVIKKETKPDVNYNTFKNKLKKAIKQRLLTMYRSMYIPDDKIFWKKDAVKLGLEIIEKEKIDIVYSTSGPYTSHLIGLELKKKTNKKWIADFRDQWVSNPFLNNSNSVTRKNEKMEKEVILFSDLVTSVSRPIIDDFIERYNNVDPDKFSVITNGYDEEDFNEFKVDKISKKFVVTYSGTLYGKRSPNNFLKAFETLIHSNKIDKTDIEIRFVGQIGRDAQAEIDSFRSAFQNIIKLIEYVPHNESIKQLEESSAVLLIIEGGRGSDGIYTGKIFEYIRSHRIIIGIVPDGVARKLILDTNSGFCCYPDSVEEIKYAIFEAYQIWKGQIENIKFNDEVIVQFNRENITKELVQLFKNKL